MSSLTLPFIKTQGSGNDFIIIDLQNKETADQWARWQQKPPRPEFAKRQCDRRFGVGADGMIFLQREAEGKWFWDFYNADGSRAEMCGNATRCIGLYVSQVYGERSFQLETIAGSIKIEASSEDEIKVQMTDAKVIESQNTEYELIDTGVPHCVMEVDNLSQREELFSLGKKYRFPEELDEKGANVTFWQKNSGQKIEAVSFERGVEDFTLACGTGAVAAAWSARREVELDKGVLVQMPGGDMLIHMKEIGPYHVWMSGRAEIVFRGEIRLP